LLADTVGMTGLGWATPCRRVQVRLARPVLGEQERARVLAALAASDAVIIFDQPTPLELIRSVRPDVLVKGETTPR
jgi:bifunctional ADP-heptose synthase (sugar kinase/adenylyltransferase)